MDYILNGQGHGDIASKLLACNFDVGVARPYVGSDGRNYVTRNINGQPKALVTNAPATLRKDEWQQLDTAVIKAAKTRLRAFADLRAAGLTYTIPDGMAKTVLQHETQSDISAATVSMDGLRNSQSDRPEYNLVNLPLPIIHKNFEFPARQVLTSRTGGSPLDTSTAELAARRVAEEVEKLTLGTASTFTYGGGTIYGYTNYTHRLTKTLTAPSSSNHATTVNEVLDMRQQAYAAGHYGPYMLYCSPNWDQYMDEDYSTAKGDITLRQRLRNIENINDVRTADQLTGTQLVLVQQTPDVARAIIGMDVTTLQWESHGGLQLNYMVMAILIPQLRADFNNNCGIVHGTV